MASLLSPSHPRQAAVTPAALDRLVTLGVAVAGLASAGLIWATLDDIPVAGVFFAVFLAVAGLAVMMARLRGAAPTALPMMDWQLLAGALNDIPDGIAITDRAGRLVCANRRYDRWFQGVATPPGLPVGREGAERLTDAGRLAWRDGEAHVRGLRSGDDVIDVAIRRAGQAEDHLIWRFATSRTLDLAAETRRAIEGELGRRLGLAGMMVALVGADGRMIAANRAFQSRAFGDAERSGGRQHFASLLRTDQDDLIRIALEPDDADPLRLIQLPLGEEGADATTLFVMLDEDNGFMLRRDMQSTATVHVHALLAALPLGLALAERDGRLTFMNDAFIRAAAVGPESAIVYPSDLVVDEDKAAVSDAVRRFASGRGISGDIAVRLKGRVEEPVTLTVAGAKGLGDAAVLLSLKDNSEESKLKRQVAQATKMQAVGQLAGGVAHDFNNILTAIIGHSDLMMMRHTPGDSDYDDIQQIKHNSNRAAGLTRQLLAFSRQQTLRPQVLQLPDVISEISNLLKRLLGETVTLIVKHGRNLGAVRADPGQLEQVIVNLAVNARDAMPGGGTLTVQTYGVGSAEVRRLRSDILPVADYTALSVSDTGTGIPPEVLGKVFEPFFTTKEVGKGTGLGLSTVYGIVKQTGGFIFADSKEGEGTSFVIYLPVHHAVAAPAEPVAPPPREDVGESWGSGTILLVEDEAMVRSVAERALTRQGYRVLTATNGEEALELLDAIGGQGGDESGGAGENGGGVDLLISDVVMPMMDGPTLVRHARDRFPDLPIVFMSGYAEEQLRRSIDLDKVAFLPKPFSVRQLGDAARSALNQNNAGQNNALAQNKA